MFSVMKTQPSKPKRHRSRKPVAPFKKLRVVWGNDDVIVELTVTKSQWARIKNGDDVRINGKGYWYEGERFQDTWYFSGGLDGELRVCYDDGGEGFIGSPRDALMHPTD
jgi:hypothetical protein